MSISAHPNRPRTVWRHLIWKAGLVGLLLVSSGAIAGRLGTGGHYKSPIRLALSRDGARLYVTCEGSHSLQVVDTKRRKVIGEVPVGKWPYDVLLDREERRVFVSNRRSNDISVIDTETLEVVRTVKTGDDPHGLALDRDERALYVANTTSNNISVIDTETWTERKRLAGGMGPFEAVLSPDGRYVYVSSLYSNPVPFRTPPIPEVTVIEARSQIVVDRKPLHSTNVLQDLAFSPDGRLAFVALAQPKNLIPETQIYQGWMSTYGLGMIEVRERGRTAQVVLDDMAFYATDPFGLAMSPDGRYLYVTSSSVDIVSVVDLKRVKDLFEVRAGRIEASEEKLNRYARDLGISEAYVVKRIRTGYNPKGIVVSADGKYVYVANRMSDSITVIDARRLEAIEDIALGGPKQETLTRRGERLFNSASISFQNQLSCNTCHPEGHLDRLTYDIAVDGLGANLVVNKTLRDIQDTAPFKWNGKNPDLFRQDGPRAAQLVFRSHGYLQEDLRALVAYIESIPLPRNPRVGNPELTPAQRRGKTIFERPYTNDGRYIPIGNQCITCHPPPLYTNRLSYDVGVQAEHDLKGSFDVPQLKGVFNRAPFLHDGRCYSLEEIWTRYNPDDLHGAANDLTKQQLNDLIEYLKGL